MKQRLTILAIVAGAIVVVLTLKPRGPQKPAAPDTAASSKASGQPHTSTVLLFADPREEDAACGCADIVWLVRGLRDNPGVVVREIDSRQAGDDARRYGVRVSPAVVILDAAGKETARFEGESESTIQALRVAFAALPHASNSVESGAGR